MVIKTVNRSDETVNKSEQKWMKVSGRNFLSLLFTFFHFLSLSLYGYTYRGAFLQLGDNVAGLTASSAARGGTSVCVSGEPTAVFKNPASISVAEGEAIISNSLISIYERIEHNDSAGTTVSNDNIFLRFSNLGASHPVIKNKLSVAVCMSELYDFNYFYEENNFLSTIAVPQLIGKNSIKSKGFIYGLGCGFSYSPSADLALGFSAYNISGKPEGEINEVDYGQASSNRGLVIADISTTTSHSFDGMFFVLGGTYELTKRTKVGIAYNPAREIEDRLTTVYKDDVAVRAAETKATNKYKYPSSLSVGMAFEFPGATQPVFSVDFVHTKWSKAKIKTGSGVWTDCGWSDTLSWQAGAQHRVRNNFIFRYGIGFLPDYSRKGSQSAVVSGGAGFKVWLVEMDVSAQYFMRRNTLEDRFFPVAADYAYPRLNQVTVDDYTKRFLLTGKIKW